MYSNIMFEWMYVFVSVNVFSHNENIPVIPYHKLGVNKNKECFITISYLTFAYFATFVTNNL